MRKQIPNLLTLLNLACGTVAIVLILESQWQWSVYLILAASLLDFLDGFTARLLHAYSKTGKQLDSLADMVSFGVLPALFIYTIFTQRFLHQDAGNSLITRYIQGIMLGTILLVPLFSAIRLARFNVAESAETFFSGLPAPAHALFWTGFFWQFMKDGQLFGYPLNIYFMWAIVLIMAFQMILPIPMYALKFEHFRLRGNLIRYLLVLVAVILLLVAGLAGLSIVILIYILLSLLNLLLQKRVSI